MRRYAPVMTVVTDCGNEGLIEKRGPAEGKRGLYNVDSKLDQFPYTVYADGRSKSV